MRSRSSHRTRTPSPLPVDEALELPLHDKRHVVVHVALPEEHVAGAERGAAAYGCELGEVDAVKVAEEGVEDLGVDVRQPLCEVPLFQRPQNLGGGATGGWN